MKANIAIVEDEPRLASLLKDYLEKSEYSATVWTDGSEALAAFHDELPDLILLDLMLPGTDGLSICKELRKTSDVPIIMLTARVEEIDRLLGLEIGADDYICKPFSPRQVIARVKAMLRRNNIAQEPLEHTEKHDGNLSLETSCYTATLEGQNLDLTPVEFRILTALYGPPARVLNRNQLMDAMYDDHRAVSDRTVDSHVANLRKKLKTISPQSEFIQPVYGVGYRYIG